MYIWFVFILVAWLTSQAFALQTRQNQGIVVGHLTYLKGNLLRQGNDSNDRVPLVEDSPVGLDDVLITGDDSRAEIIIPNNTWIRLGGDTHTRIISLENDITEIAVNAGTARFYNKSTSATIKAITPFGTVIGPPLTTFDVYLDGESVQVTALAGTVNYNHVSDNSSHEVRAGFSSLRANNRTITAGDEMVDEDFHAWNAERDALWNDRLEAQTEARSYLPANLNYASYSLQENGVWETVYYQGRNCNFWRPTYVSSYWSPFTVGSWSVWYGDHCWIPYEPFGYVTHHYGNWIYVDSCDRWYWAPPSCHIRTEYISVSIPFAWYPGRVSWIYNDDCIGWIPLAPYEPYYCHRSWGPHTYVVGIDRLRRVHVDMGHRRYKEHAVIVRKHDFRTAINYSTFRIKQRGKDNLDSYRRTAVLPLTLSETLKRVSRSSPMRNLPLGKRPRPATGKEKAQHSKDALFTRKTMKGDLKGVSALNTANPVRKPLSKMSRPSDNRITFRDKNTSGRLPSPRTAAFAKKYNAADAAQTKLWERPLPQAMVPKKVNKPLKALPHLTPQGPKRTAASSSAWVRPLPQTDTQRPTGMMRIQPQPERHMLNTRKQAISPQPRGLRGGEAKTAGNNMPPRLRTHPGRTAFQVD